LDLCLGGIFDQVGGGFHRYTVDQTWTVPHFEKMLYDNGQILEFLSRAWGQGQREPAIQRAVALTVDWLDREMTSPEGYFYASQDADSEGEEGKFYVWSLAELQEVLTKEQLQLLEQTFTLTETGNFEQNTNVLQRLKVGEFPALLEEILAQLLLLRSQRIAPATDTKLVLAWNGLMISGLVAAAATFGEASYQERAIRCAEFLLAHQWHGKQLLRVNYSNIEAAAEDFALFIKALLDLFELTQAAQWLEQAIRLQELMDEQLWDIELGGYFTASSQRKAELILREKDYQDNATPSANGIAAHNLIRLFLLTDQAQYLTQAERLFLAFAQILEQAPRACPTLLAALDLYGNCCLVQPFTKDLLARLQSSYYPAVIYKLCPQPEDTEGAVALLCKGTTCLQPIYAEKELLTQLQNLSCRQGG